MTITRHLKLWTLGTTCFAAAWAQTTEHSVGPAETSVQSKTYVKDGKTVTERTLTTKVTETEAVTKPLEFKVAIVVTNRAGTKGDAELGALEDYITGRVTDLGVHVISRDTMSNAVSSLDPHAAKTKLDAELADATSAVRLSQTLGADYLLQVSLSGIEANKRTVDAYGVKTVNEEHVARLTYKILDGTTGASLAADTVRTAKTVQQTSTANDEQSGVLNGLLEEAAGKVATSLQRSIDRGRLTAPAAAAGLVTVTLTTEVADLYIPDVRIGAENTISISESKFKVSALSATVEVDGIAVGTAPGKVTVKPGLSKLRVVREGFKPWERTVNFADGQKLAVTLEMSADGYAKWKDATAFINDLKNGAKMTDAQVKALEGLGKMLEQSGFKIDTKEGIKIKHSIF